MSESICLHIQDRESGPIRVVEIPWISVRIGSAAYCEVRLADSPLAAEACRLQRRRRTWHLVPIGSKGSILIQDRPIDGPCPLPFDVPFRIGAICFTLRHSRSADPDWEMYRAHAPVQGQIQTVSALPTPLPASAVRAAAIVPAVPQRTVVHEAAIPSTPRLEPLPERAPGPRPVNPWEARWKAAGARLKDDRKQPAPAGKLRSGPSVDRYQSIPLKEPIVPSSTIAETVGSPSWLTGFSAHPHTPTTTPAYPAHRGVPPRSRLDTDLPIKTAAPPVEPTIPKARLEDFTPRVWQPASAWRTPDQDRSLDGSYLNLPEVRIASGDDVLDHAEAEPENGPAPIGDPLPAPWIEADSPVGESVEEPGDQAVCLGDDPVVEHQPAVDVWDCQSVCDPSSRLQSEPLEECSAAAPLALEQPEPEVLPLGSLEEEVWDDPARIAPPGGRGVAETSWTDTTSYLEMASAELIVSTSTEACGHPQASVSESEEGARRPTLRTATLLDPGTLPAADRPSVSEEAMWPGSAWQEPRIDPPISRAKAGSDLPSAKDILAAASVRRSEGSGKPLHRNDEDQGKPTECRNPDQWLPPLWLVWPPMALLVIGLGMMGSLLSLRWAVDSFNASVVSQRLLARSENPGKQKPLPESVVPPGSCWWQTTPLHLEEWGIYLGRQKLDGDRTEEGRELIEAAVRMSPISPTARLARAQLAARSSRPANGVLGLGLTRDAVSLALSARILRLAGKKEAAIRVYRQALRLACNNELASASKPTFNDEPNARDELSGRRYFLPGETTARTVLRELVANGGLAPQDWTEVLPGHPVATLAAARLLRERDRPEALSLLEQILKHEQEMEPADAEGAVQTAVRAEAHALLSQWKEAEQQYHQAIDQINDLTIKRSWWFNLASVAIQLNDEAQRKVALEAAREAPTSDDISRRALELQRASDPLGRLRSSGTKAN